MSAPPPETPKSEQRFWLGVNYWPMRHAMLFWRAFEPEEVARDFARLQEAGVDLVRLFLLWEDFQPEPDRIARSSLENLKTVADLASHYGLRLLITFFTGHMSGANWLPAWACEPSDVRPRFRALVGGRPRTARSKNWYTDSDLREAQRRLIGEVVSALATHPALWGWDLGNEPSNCVIPPSRESGLAWLADMTAEIRALDPRHPITLGLHMEDLEEDRRLGPTEVAQVCDLLSMHGYPIYTSWAEGPTDVWLLPFLGLLTRWLGGGRDLLFEEFGAPTRPPLGEIGFTPVPLLDEEEAARFIGEALALLRDFGFAGALLWCYGDYAPELWSRPPFDEAPHERFSGLWRSDGTPKPAVAALRSWAGQTRYPPHSDFLWIDIAPEEFSANPRFHLHRLYRRFRQKYA